MRRRDFVTLLGGAAAWPLAASSQQPAMPVVGFLYLGTPDPNQPLVAAFRKGLTESGFLEGRNVTIEYRFAYAPNRLLELATDLVRRRVAVIAAPGGPPAALAAKAATTTIPIVFEVGTDPVQEGLVASFNRPGGNITGFTAMNRDIDGNRLGMLCELVPGARRVAVLTRPPAADAESRTKHLRAAAVSLGRQFELTVAGSSREIDAAFVSFVERRVDALLVTASSLLYGFRVLLATVAARHAIPAIYPDRAFPEAGGLMSYGTNAAEPFHQVGIYTARILKGEKPSDLPVQQPTKFELVINLQTARTLRLEVPPTLLARADEAIE
jgi:putative tryptophan/tyrosine transport system substrate-binding protein